MQLSLLNIIISYFFTPKPFELAFGHETWLVSFSASSEDYPTKEASDYVPYQPDLLTGYPFT